MPARRWPRGPRGGASTGSVRAARDRPGARGVVVGRSAARSDRPQPDVGRDRARRRRSRDGDRALLAARSSRSAFRDASSASATAMCVSPSCLLPSGARRLRARSSSPVLVAEPRSGKDGFDERTWLRRHGVHVVLRGRDPRSSVAEEASAGLLTGSGLRSAPRSRLVSPASGVPCCSGSCSGRTRARRGPRDAFRASGSTTCSPSPARMSRSSPAACSSSRGCSASRAWRAGSARWSRSVHTCSPSAPNRRWFGQGSPAGWRPSPGCVLASGIAGGSCSSARSCCSRGTPTTCSTRLPALVRRGRRDLHARAPSDGPTGGISVTAGGGSGRRGIDRVRGRDGPILLFQFGSVPAYSVIANAMAAPVVARVARARAPLGGASSVRA